MLSPLPALIRCSDTASCCCMEWTPPPWIVAPTLHPAVIIPIKPSALPSPCCSGPDWDSHCHYIQYISVLYKSNTTASVMCSRSAGWKLLLNTRLQYRNDTSCQTSRIRRNELRHCKNIRFLSSSSTHYVSFRGLSRVSSQGSEPAH